MERRCAEPFDPIRQVAARESSIEFGIERLVVVDSCLADVESLVRLELRCSSAATSVPELSREDRCIAIRRSSACAECRLGETRTIARRRRGAKRKEGGKGFYGKMRHGLEHRNLNQCALAGPAALHQRAQDAVGRVNSGDRVRESGPKKRGRLESTTTLRNR